MAFQHGVYIQELDTKILGVRTCDSALPFVVGSAPVQSLTGDKPINQAKLIFNYKEFVSTFGDVPAGQSESSYTLSQFARIYYALYGMSPAIFVNVFDPAVHEDAQGNPNPSLVAPNDIIGGVDAGTGKRTGLELIEETFSSFGKVAGTILAPGYGHVASVANALIAKAEKVCNHFKAMAYFDIPTTIEKPADALAFKAAFGSPHAVIVWPQAKYGDQLHWLSAHAAGLTAKVDEKNTGVPYESPSNKELRIDGPANFHLNHVGYKDRYLELH